MVGSYASLSVYSLYEDLVKISEDLVEKVITIHFLAHSDAFDLPGERGG